MGSDMLAKAEQIETQLVAWRRDIHQHPELGFQEVRTAALVAEELDRLGYRVQTGIGRTGVVAELGAGNPVVAVRADMDALPIEEANQAPYRSRVPGVMHACGHDAHTAIALGVATLLGRETFSGTVRLLFQPAEEVEDEDGLSGASRMIQEGAIDGVELVIALHVDAAIKTGEISLSAGPVSAGVDTLYASILGQGGHGSSPHKVVDPIYLSGHVILALHGIVSRRIRPRSPAVISIGSIHGGRADNVIPEKVDLSATIRYLQPAVQEQLHQEIVRALGVARAMGGDTVHRIVRGYPPMHNDERATELLREIATEMIGADQVEPTDPGMGAEDFGFFSARAPGAMFMLGCRIEDDERRHHDPRFDIDERCLPLGAGILAETVLRYLDRGGWVAESGTSK